MIKAGVFRVGVMLELAEADYMYGTGTLAIKLTRVDVDPAQYPAMEWVEVACVPVYASGTHGQGRLVTIRVSAIPDALRPDNWLPEW